MFAQLRKHEKSSYLAANCIYMSIISNLFKVPFETDNVHMFTPQEVVLPSPV